MSLQGRLIGAVTAVTLVTLGGAFSAVSVAVNGAQERRLDSALLSLAVEEAEEAALLGAREISDRPGPAANEVGPLTKYGAIYLPDGAVLAATPTFGRLTPRLASLRHATRVPFDFWFGREHLRAVLVSLPDHPGTLLLATPRADLDSDEASLRRAMLSVFAVAVAWSMLVATWVVRRLTRDHAALTSVVRRVAAGDLRARMASRSGDRETTQLAHDVNEMVERLELLLTSQQRFVAYAAHELRAPLTTLLGELSHALRRPRDAESYRSAIEEALDATRRLKLMADDLLTLARLGAEGITPVESVDLAAVIRAAVGEVSVQASTAGVTIEVHHEGSAAPMRGHSRDLERLVRNLLDNAIRHSPRGGTVTVRARAHTDAVELSVADRGDGVPDEDRVRIFEPFYRAPSDRAFYETGSGLGLSIVRQIARSHGGEVALESENPPSAGARFVLRIPLQ